MASSRRGWVWLLAGLVFALLAALLAMAAVEARVQQAAGEPAARPGAAEAKAAVVVAALHIPVTHAITEADVSLKEFPVNLIPDGAATSIEQVVGKVSMADIYPGEIILLLRLAEPDVRAENVAFTMPQDKVLFALPPDDLMSRIDLLRAGDVIDILFSLTPKAEMMGAGAGGSGEESEQPLGDPMFTTDALQAQHITAIVVEAPASAGTAAQATGQRVAQEAMGAARPQAILLALAPQDALILKYFRDAGGKMDIVLRHRQSEELFDVRSVNYDYIKDRYGLQQAAPAIGR
jgi:Flp pilus assembly protein CpaB